MARCSPYLTAALLHSSVKKLYEYIRENVKILIYRLNERLNPEL